MSPPHTPPQSHASTPATENVAELIRWNQQRCEARYGLAEVRAIGSVGIVGAGTMGASIAASANAVKMPVVITDARPEALDDLPARVAAELAAPGEPAAELPAPELLRATSDMDEVARCDLVLEAVVEHLMVKDDLLPKLEARLAEGSTLASNTSTISIGRLSERLAQPERFCGIHFFLPVHQGRLIEVIRGPKSSTATLATAAQLAWRLGKMPLVVSDGPGFLVNRLMMMYLSDALQLVAEGASIAEVESVAVEFGMTMGPMTLLDRIGLDVALDCAWVLATELGESIVRSRLLVALVKKKRLGQKTGQGFFRYESGRKLGGGQPDPDLTPLLEKCAEPPRKFDRQTIVARLFLPMLLEATRVMAEGRVDDPRDVDLGVIFGFGFPAAQGGLLYWADTLGPRRILEMLEPLSAMGFRTRPTPMLEEMAAGNKRFYAPPATGANPEESEVDV